MQCNDHAVLVETYMRGECHIHAIAAQRQHGGGFAVAYDDSEIYFESDEESVSSILHVWSVHLTDEGVIARDFLGDIPFTRNAMAEHLEEFFPDLIGKFEWGDAWIDMQATLEEITSHSGDEDHQPLCAIREEYLAEAAALSSVRDAPGSRRLEASLAAEEPHPL